MSDADAMDNVTGSFIVLRANNVEQIWDVLKSDSFYVSGEVVSIVCLLFQLLDIRTCSGIPRASRSLRSFRRVLL
ncbi:hypothetical protein C8Q80DRAFT_1196684 [Daedaleopsis nitida]|nr:hypothetical protein C8Q80DRAFT_1196684 [Daedaleopsis nitida]